ncbi:MAG TPA: GxxExxY protein [Chitinophagaceae bacterium]|nr:GxxExxY protein [Chitinophagaceae bacterium]
MVWDFENVMIEDLKYNQVTQTIIGAAMKVHSKMKNRYVAAVYQKCMDIELKKAGLEFQQEIDLPIYYDGVIVRRKRIDYIVDKKIILELKAITTLENNHLAQAINYLESHLLQIGLLLNFGGKSLQFKRLVNGQKTDALKNPVNPTYP